MPIRAENIADLDTQSSLWDLRERFGVRQAQWLPYWSNASCVAVRPKGCYVSLYRHPANGVLLCVSNLTREAADIEIVLNEKSLDLKLPLSARNALTSEAVNIKGATLRLSLPSQEWRMIWVRSEVSGDRC